MNLVWLDNLFHNFFIMTVEENNAIAEVDNYLNEKEDTNPANLDINGITLREFHNLDEATANSKVAIPSKIPRSHVLQSPIAPKLEQFKFRLKSTSDLERAANQQQPLKAQASDDVLIYKYYFLKQIIYLYNINRQVDLVDYTKMLR